MLDTFEVVKLDGLVYILLKKELTVSRILVDFFQAQRKSGVKARLSVSDYFHLSRILHPFPVGSGQQYMEKLSYGRH